MGDVLAGIHSSWEFDTESVLIRFERGLRTPKLFHVLGERRVPYEALRAVEIAPGTKRGTVELQVTLRDGADPLLEAADGQLRDAANPYRLVAPADRESQLVAFGDQLRAAVPPDADQAAERFLVAAPEAPLSFKAYDGKVSFDGATVSYRWFWTGASSAKWKAGDQFFQVDELSGVEWRSPEISGGHLRMVRRGAERQQSCPGPGETEDPASTPDEDPSAVVFGLGCGLVHESLPVAASVLAALRSTRPGECGSSATSGGLGDGALDARANPAEVATRIRHLGELHAEGLITDEEFSVKKRDLLAEL